MFHRSNEPVGDVQPEFNCTDSGEEGAGNLVLRSGNQRRESGISSGLGILVEFDSMIRSGIPNLSFYLRKLRRCNTWGKKKLSLQKQEALGHETLFRPVLGTAFLIP